MERDEENSKTIGHISSSLTCAKKIDENYSQEAREKDENKTIGDEGITVDFRFIKVHTSN